MVREISEADVQHEQRTLRGTRLEGFVQAAVGAWPALRHPGRALRRAVLGDGQKREQEGTKAILLLSDLLRYMLYDKALEKERVSFKKELAHFERYIALRNLVHPQQQIQLHTPGEVPMGAIEGLRLQQCVEAGLQQWQQVAGIITIELTCSEAVVTLSLETPCQQKNHQHIPLFPDHA